MVEETKESNEIKTSLITESKSNTNVELNKIKSKFIESKIATTTNHYQCG